MRLFAFYLPQFHETEENNKWWGKGFTEWTHVRGAKPIYRGHIQPVVPKNENYYNLMDKDTVRWQTELMKQYGVDGFVYYHYYFTGKKLLEKPAENLLKWRDIAQPFFFCWANHTWYKAVNGVKNVLIEQTYGDEKDWRAHFEYLLPFFQDPRYEKKDNRPVFMIYVPTFPEKNAMVACFDRWCKEAGFAGIFIIETFSDASNPQNYRDIQDNRSNYTELIYIREPAVSKICEDLKIMHSPKRIVWKIRRELAYHGVMPWVSRYSGNRLFQHMIDYKHTGDDVCHGLFFSWDNTPRHGVRGYVITPPSKESFLKYIDSVQNDEYVFINAWNEWAEGMVLEPTEHDGYKFLSWIKEWKEKIER